MEIGLHFSPSLRLIVWCTIVAVTARTDISTTCQVNFHCHLRCFFNHSIFFHSSSFPFSKYNWFGLHLCRIFFTLMAQSLPSFCLHFYHGNILDKKGKPLRILYFNSLIRFWLWVGSGSVKSKRRTKNIILICSRRRILTGYGAWPHIYLDCGSLVEFIKGKYFFLTRSMVSVKNFGWNNWISEMISFLKTTKETWYEVLLSQVPIFDNHRCS